MEARNQLPDPMRDWLHLDLPLALRNLLRHGRRSLLGLLIVAGGVVAYMQAAGFIAWIYDAMRENVIRSQLGHFQVTRAGYLERGLADPYRFLLDPAASDLAALRATPGLAGLSPRLAVNGLISKGELAVGFLGEGIDPVAEQSISSGIAIRQGHNLARPDEPAVILGEGLAAAIDAKPGDLVVLLANRVRGGQNAVECRVAGIFSTDTKAYDDAFLRLPLSVARELIRNPGATTLVGLLDRTERTDATVAALRPALDRAGYDIVPWHAQADFYQKTVALFSRQVGVIRLIIALIIVLSISNTLTMSVMERTSEIGTCLAIGNRRREILSLFVTEGLVLGLAGAAVGIAVGALCAWLISWIGIPMPPPPGMAHGFVGGIRVTPAILLEALLLASLTTLLASVLPAVKASRLDVVDALRHGR